MSEFPALLNISCDIVLFFGTSAWLNMAYSLIKGQASHALCLKAMLQKLASRPRGHLETNINPGKLLMAAKF